MVSLRFLARQYKLRPAISCARLDLRRKLRGVCCAALVWLHQRMLLTASAPDVRSMKPCGVGSLAVWEQSTTEVVDAGAAPSTTAHSLAMDEVVARTRFTVV